MQDLIRIRVADATNDPRIGESSLERTVFGRKRGSKRGEIARKNVDSARVEGTQTILTRDDMQRRAAFCAGFGNHQRAVRKIEGCQTLASRQLCLRRAPV